MTSLGLNALEPLFAMGLEDQENIRALASKVLVTFLVSCTEDTSVLLRMLNARSYYPAYNNFLDKYAQEFIDLDPSEDQEQEPADHRERPNSQHSEVHDPTTTRERRLQEIQDLANLLEPVTHEIVE